MTGAALIASGVIVLGATGLGASLVLPGSDGPDRQSGTASYGLRGEGPPGGRLVLDGLTPARNVREGAVEIAAPLEPLVDSARSAGDHARLPSTLRPGHDSAGTDLAGEPVERRFAGSPIGDQPGETVGPQPVELQLPPTGGDGAPGQPPTGLPTAPLVPTGVPPLVPTGVPPLVPPGAPPAVPPAAPPVELANQPVGAADPDDAFEILPGVEVLEPLPDAGDDPGHVFVPLPGVDLGQTFEPIVVGPDGLVGDDDPYVVGPIVGDDPGQVLGVLPGGEPGQVFVPLPGVDPGQVFVPLPGVDPGQLFEPLPGDWVGELDRDPGVDLGQTFEPIGSGPGGLVGGDDVYVVGPIVDAGPGQLFEPVPGDWVGELGPDDAGGQLGQTFVPISAQPDQVVQLDAGDQPGQVFAPLHAEGAGGAPAGEPAAPTVAAKPADSEPPHAAVEPAASPAGTQPSEGDDPPAPQSRPAESDPPADGGDDAASELGVD